MSRTGGSGRDGVAGRPADHVVLDCAGLTKDFGRGPVVHDLSFTVSAGEAYGLLGPNGAGKSTTIRMICGLLAPDDGKVVGTAVSDRGDNVSTTIGYVPQDLALFPTLTLDENLQYWARILGMHRRERAEQIDGVLTTVGLLGHRDQRVSRTSGGMQRRLNLAIGLLGDPRLLVLDEPTAGVDAQSRAAVVAAIAALRDGGMAVLYTSHHMDEAERLCDRVGIMDRGAMVLEGPPDELVRDRDAADLFDLYLELTGRDMRE